MKLIHCADFHLDAPFSAEFTPEQARLRRQELLSAFARMVDYAAENDISVILIAGDLFDCAQPSREAVRTVSEIVAAHPSISFYYLRGNHDAVFSEPLPDNVYLFGDTWRTYSCGNVTISGIEPNASTEWYDDLQVDPLKCNIVLLHGQVSTSAGTDRVAAARLRNRGIDYLALGHLHTYQTDVLDARGVWGYAGCPEGRGFDEPGEKGFIVLETDFGAIKYRFIPFAVRTLHQCNVDISADRTVLQQEEHVLQTLSTVSERDMVRVVLTGAVPPEQYIDAGAIQKMLRSRFFAARVQNATTLALDDAVLANELSLRGAFYRLVQAEDLSEDDRAAILRAGFAALSGEEIPTEFHSR